MRAAQLLLPASEWPRARVNVLVLSDFVARAEAAGLALGDKAPAMLTSRADNDRARLVSSALARLCRYWAAGALDGDPRIAVAAE